ncbi:hypothetical protein CDAR_264151, partial [Caerostris darwini]
IINALEWRETVKVLIQPKDFSLRQLFTEKKIKKDAPAKEEKKKKI